MLIALPIVLVVAIVGSAIAIRSAGHDVDRWHVDPLTAPTPTTPNSFRLVPADSDVDADGVAPVFDRPTEQLARDFDRVARADARVEVLAGSAVDGFVTYVQRSALFGFPDYVSVTFLDADGGSTLAVFSRSRYGKSDLGVNQKRVERWLTQL